MSFSHKLISRKSLQAVLPLKRHMDTIARARTPVMRSQKRESTQESERNMPVRIPKVNIMQSH